ncbi:DNA repair protein RecN [[Clostridium] fimetarium]|uniref:DNA repair protein RecN n=1 Tax=[Clostridium] fimetarium TaxID=99656 RepID=A0A1I0RVQ8_9FIRM|nr:DNA repair protein RecN [[Clostridium] fimetarium]SEW45388.1 DNA repair protein RecN (Recombination protein N) [[Clostridium] fimetarium]
MLLNLYVKNMALIEEADISFKKGLNILTGETGAGKSIIIGSINVALGNKVSADIIRKGAEYALVELSFKINDQDKINELKAMDIEELDEGQILISRKITSSRSVIKVNGETVTASQVKQIAAILIDIHGQHEHQSLLNESKHLELIDKFADSKITEHKNVLKQEYSRYFDIKKKLDDMSIDDEQRQREIAFFQFEINDIESAGLKDGEDEELEIQFKKMVNSQKIIDEISQVNNYIGESNFDNASDMVSKSVKALTNVVGYDESLEPMLAQLNDLESILNDLGRDISNYISDSEFNAEEFEYVQNRLNTINNLKMKYGRTINDILKYRDVKSEKLTEYENFDSVKETLIHNLKKSEDNMNEYCEKLSIIRKEAGTKLSERIRQALIELNFIEVKFEVEFNKSNNFTANGFDTAKFMISTNPGEDIKALAKIASGGEMSRIMLAIKTVLADKDDIETLIFDEIDTGISGRTAQMVSNKLNEISSMHQIICITHLPQIASMADTHFLIEKSLKDNSTVTSIFELNEKSSIEELARLLGGTTITDAVITNASEMKSMAMESKRRKSTL